VQLSDYLVFEKLKVGSTGDTEQTTRQAKRQWNKAVLADLGVRIREKGYTLPRNWVLIDPIIHHTGVESVVVRLSVEHLTGMISREPNDYRLTWKSRPVGGEQLFIQQ